jgi:hypothetical protein
LRVSNFSIALFKDSIFCSRKNIPVLFSTTVSRAPHFQYAITGVQLAIAAIGTRPKSSSGGKIKALAFACNLFNFCKSHDRIHSMLLLDFSFNSLYNVLSVFVAIIIFFQFSLNASTIKSNFLYGIHLPL